MKDKHSLKYCVEFDPDTTDAEVEMGVHCTTEEAILFLADALAEVCKAAGLKTSGKWMEVMKMFSSFYVLGMMKSILSDGKNL